MEKVPGNERSQSIRELLDSGLLEEKEVELRLALLDKPNDVPLLRKLGQILRSLGDLSAAAKTYQHLKQLVPGDPHVARLHALFASQTLPSVPNVASKFAILQDFLSPQRVRDIRAHVRNKKDRFQACKVRSRQNGESLDLQKRISSFCPELGSIRDWFDPMVLGQFLKLLEQLDIEAFQPGLYSCKLNAYHDGHFFHIHQDKSTGVAATRRLGFVYYFEFEPRRFRGGELLLYDRDVDTLYPAPSFTTIMPKHNMLIVIPAICWHEVLPIRMTDDDWFAARFTYSGWIHDESLLVHR
jgi:hypothetical protein